MIKRIAEWLEPVLEMSFIRQTRRNHGLEHATIHLLQRHNYHLSGRSDAGGFLIWGDVPTEKLESSVEEAIQRMKAGQHTLAIHPNCGTNLATTAFMSTFVGMIGFAGSTRKNAMDRFSLVMIMMVGVILYSPFVGTALQKHITTKGDIGDLELVRVTRREMTLPFRNRPMIVHQVMTTGG